MIHHPYWLTYPYFKSTDKWVDLGTSSMDGGTPVYCSDLNCGNVKSEIDYVTLFKTISYFIGLPQELIILKIKKTRAMILKLLSHALQCVLKIITYVLPSSLLNIVILSNLTVFNFNYVYIVMSNHYKTIKPFSFWLKWRIIQLTFIRILESMHNRLMHVVLYCVAFLN
jgi:hypothetical protein